MNYFLYLVVIILIVLYIYISYNYELFKIKKTIESYKTYQYFNNNFTLSKDQFIQHINKEFKKEWKEIISNYINDFNTINLISRNAKTKTELINKYTNLCLLPISQDNINNINNMLITNLKNNNLYKKKDIKKIIELIIDILPSLRIIKCSQDLELGFPHTHKNIIIFSSEYFANPSFTTFIHECIHIDQRLNPDKYYKIYSEWGFINYPVSQIKDFTDIIRKSRNNPDGRDINWLWISPTNKAYWIGAVFKTEYPSSISQVENRIYYINNENDGYNTIKKIGKYLGKSELIHNNIEFKSVFGLLTNNNYHPNEIAAELAVNLYKSTNKSIAIQKLLEYI
jgi:hypothetical protein